jgi:hypothetical protein
MNEQLQQLQDLADQLHEANEEFAQAAKPLHALRDLSFEQQQRIAAALRKAQERWRSLTEQISETLQKLELKAKG